MTKPSSTEPSESGWSLVVRHPILCATCPNPAVYHHPKHGFRCGTCTRPGWM